jgi:hypothetical protein
MTSSFGSLTPIPTIVTTPAQPPKPSIYIHNFL